MERIYGLHGEASQGERPTPDAGDAAPAIIHIGNAVNDLFQAQRVAHDNIQLRMILLADHFAEGSGVAEDETERRAQFVLGDGDKIALHLVELNYLIE